MRKQCCQCKRININGQWVYPRLSQLFEEEIVPGVCNRCGTELPPLNLMQRAITFINRWRRNAD